MSDPKPKSWRQVTSAVLALIVVGRLSAVVVYGISKILTGTLGGAIAGGLVGMVVAVASKSFEYQKDHEAALAEKKREVYRRLLIPWERLLVDLRSKKDGDDLLANVDLPALYASSFDAVLYGSAAVVQKYVEFRSPDHERDPLDNLRALAGLLIAMREDVTGKKANLSEESVLKTFINFKPEELVMLRLREYVSKNPEAQRKLAEVLARGPLSPAEPTAKTVDSKRT